MLSARITDKETILGIFRKYLARQTKCRFLVEIFTREHRPGGIIFEGAAPLSIYSECATGEYHITLTSSDSDYCRPIATLKLSQIEYITELIY